ncbi:hypothetical protein GCK32_021473 [Trichostrongylus colubriformis]|uniref:Uncharacterized protein n=1 Tax=Trichostrongylus colubriformis TaxID=6319 RepID=A0AAN8F6B3_TRICO
MKVLLMLVMLTAFLMSPVVEAGLPKYPDPNRPNFLRFG